ncbi:MAG TPA: hypothetical protein EYH48_00905 [Aquifex aeolicus]|uniref:SHS2 domain-containing protein n=1 Tax=Aquifex aeolicus TaxID=63363 RepID=A0A9D1CGM9_AQUAO|nr:hypothetical protein [Aquificales bacterium]HIP98693.1 hypothetical protein [Aquifex aeolicus]HIQ25881.1 hypothetical protein [Aquifex aeolicus]
MSETIGILDIGSGYIKVLVSFIDDDDDIRTEPLFVDKRESKGIEEGVIVRASSARNAIREILDSVRDRNGGEIGKLYLLVSHPKVKYSNTSVSLQISSPQEGEFSEVKEEHLKELSEMVRRESQEPEYEIIHIVPKYFLLDGEKYYEPVGLHATTIEGVYHVIKLKKQVYLNLRNLVRSLNYDVNRIMLPVFTASYEILTEEDSKKRILLIDFGHTTTGFSYFVDGSPEITGVISGGIRDAIEILSAQYKIPTKNAQELIKDIGYYRRQGYSLEVEEENITLELEEGDVITVSKNEIGNILKGVVAEILAKIFEKLFEDKQIDITKDLDEIVLIGGGARLPHFKELVEELIEEVEIPYCLVRIGKGKYLTYYDAEFAQKGDLLETDFAPARGVVELIRRGREWWWEETSGSNNPLLLNEKKIEPTYEEATLVESLEEKPKKQNLWSKIMNFFKNLISEE